MPENWVFLLKYWVVFYQQMNWIGRMNWIPDLKKKKKNHSANKKSPHWMDTLYLTKVQLCSGYSELC